MRERFTLGVEEEYQLVDPQTRELRSGGRHVLATDRTGELTGEMQDTMVEIGTPVCRAADELEERLRERRFQAGAAAAAMDLEMLAIGTHPFSGWKEQELTRTPRSLMLRERFRHLVRLDHICGMHVHVAVPEQLDRIALMDVVRAYTPHLLALSCSSPYHAGEETGFDSYRTVAWRRFPLSGASPRFGCESAHRAFMDVLLRSGMIPDERTVYWSVRPSPRYPTIEVRVCDVCPNLGDAVAIAALTRALVVAAAEDRLQPPGSSLEPALQDVVLRENEWVAARDGLDAVLVAPERINAQAPVRDAIRQLLETVGPIAESLGDTAALQGIARILEEGNGADRMRRQHAAGGDLRRVVAWAVAETRAGAGMDRRRTGRA